MAPMHATADQIFGKQVCARVADRRIRVGQGGTRVNSGRGVQLQAVPLSHLAKPFCLDDCALQGAVYGHLV